MNNCEFSNMFSDYSLNEYTSHLTDAILLTEDGWSFPIHRLILIKSSIFFRTLFCTFKDYNQEFLVPRITGPSLNTILGYIYKGVTSLTNENISELLIAADYLQVDDLVIYIMDNMSSDNCFKIYMTSLKMNNERLIKLSYRYIQTHFEAVVRFNETEFVDISFDLLKQLLSDNNLRVEGEHVVWSSIVKWVLKEPAHRLCKVYDLLTCMKIAEIDVSLASEIIRSDVMSNNPSFENLETNDIQDNVHNSLNVLKHIFENVSPVDNFHSLRLPRYLHVIADFSYGWNISHGPVQKTRLYITYDENLDIWLELDEKQCAPSFFFIHGHNIYMYDYFMEKFVSFNLIACRWSKIRRPSRDFFIENVVMHGHNIICIGSNFGNDETATSLKCYNTDNGNWFNGPNLENVITNSVKAVPYQNKVYIVGPKKLSLSMEAQIYSTESNSFSNFISPMIYRKRFKFTEYHGKLFIIGGYDESDKPLNKVEVFDPERSTWNLKADLPFPYTYPKVTVFKSQLIVCDKIFDENRPVAWNETEEKWELVERPLGTKDIRHYEFVTIDSFETIHALVQESRELSADLKKSPFT